MTFEWTLIAAVVIFLVIIWLLVDILLFARKKMIPEGSVKIKINGKKEIEHERGCTLLQALADAQVFVPSACGGGGSCGTCRGKVLSGGGEILVPRSSLFGDHTWVCCPENVSSLDSFFLPVSWSA